MESGKIIELSDDEPFYFDCQSRVPCFNACCRDLNQFLTPYDIDRLKTTERVAGLAAIEISDAIKNDDDKLLRFCMNYLKKYFLSFQPK